MKRILKQSTAIFLFILILATFTPFAVFAQDTPPPINEMTRIFEEEVTQSGMVYGPWFGNGNEVFSTQLTGWANIASQILGGISLFIPAAPANVVAAAIAYVASLYATYGRDPDYISGRIQKTYREVKYSDGTFAWFQSRYVITSTLYTKGGGVHSLGTQTEYYEGPYPMSA